MGLTGISVAFHSAPHSSCVFVNQQSACTIPLSDVFSSCYRSDESRSFTLLIRKSPVWGGTTCLQMGMSADARLFFSHDGVQVGDFFFVLFSHTCLSDAQKRSAKTSNCAINKNSSIAAEPAIRLTRLCLCSLLASFSENFQINFNVFLILLTIW